MSYDILVFSDLLCPYIHTYVHMHFELSVNEDNDSQGKKKYFIWFLLNVEASWTTSKTCTITTVNIAPNIIQSSRFKWPMEVTPVFEVAGSGKGYRNKTKGSHTHFHKQHARRDDWPQEATTGQRKSLLPGGLSLWVSLWTRNLYGRSPQYNDCPVLFTLLAASRHPPPNTPTDRR